jgi:hypothetical protein
MIEEQYWKRTNGEVIAVADMNKHHARNVLRKMIKKSRQRGEDALKMRAEICQIRNLLDSVNKHIL